MPNALFWISVALIGGFTVWIRTKQVESNVVGAARALTARELQAKIDAELMRYLNDHT